MAREKGTTEALTAYKMAKRIAGREDNIYDRRIIENILNMYMDECRKALLRGERIQIKKVGTIIPGAILKKWTQNHKNCYNKLNTQ